uniref:Uncharacterized protein LOC117308944 n=1 Tax=Tursiops truncatus TaxID=9739 RepID=A0A6J3QCQ0_TURTR|nr:uncharacterized protein LOC117308944 [Tursiops truncatus]
MESGTRKWRSSVKRPLGGPWGGHLRCPETPTLGEASSGLLPLLPSATTGQQAPKETVARQAAGGENLLLVGQPPAPCRAQQEGDNGQQQDPTQTRQGFYKQHAESPEPPYEDSTDKHPAFQAGVTGNNCVLGTDVQVCKTSSKKDPNRVTFKGLDKQPDQGIPPARPAHLHRRCADYSWVPTFTHLHVLFLPPRRPFFPLSICQLLLTLPRLKKPPAEPVSPVPLLCGLHNTLSYLCHYASNGDCLALPLFPPGRAWAAPSLPLCPQPASPHRKGTEWWLLHRSLAPCPPHSPTQQGAEPRPR